MLQKQHIPDNDPSLQVPHRFATLPISPKPQLEKALAYQKEGRLQEAETIYRNILKSHPDNIHALHLLGVVATYSGNAPQALPLIKKALSLNPGYYKAQNNLGDALLKCGRLDDAIEEFKNALKTAPRYEQALSSLVDLLRENERFDELVECLKEYLDAAPDCFNLKKELGFTLAQIDEYVEAEKYLQECIDEQPRIAQIHFNLGCIQKKQNKLVQAQIAFNVALEIDPDYTTARNNLAVIYTQVSRNLEAIPLFEEVAEVTPNDWQVWNNLAIAYRREGRFDESFDASEHAIKADPENHESYNELGATYQSYGDIDQAIKNYRRTLALKPDAISSEKNLLFAYLNVANMSSEELFENHRELRAKHNRAEYSTKQFPDRDRSRKRRLKVGYISSDFRTHVVSLNVMPVITNHNAAEIETFLYAEVEKPDQVTKSFEKIADHFKYTVDMTDKEIAAMIEEDQIDIAVYLAGRFDSNRPTVCCYRPAPVQVSFHDCATTGLDEMDYWLTDETLHPKDTPELFTEELYRLPVYYQYPVHEFIPEILELPADKNGFITFGSFNKPEKINADVVALWSRVLKAVPDSKLFFKYFTLFAEPNIQKLWRDRFSDHGIDQDRLLFHASKDKRSDHLGIMAKADISLDPFPFNGATTTFDSLSMGVPVICLQGKHFVDRVGGSLATHAGHPELVAGSEDDYIEIARKFARDRSALRALRVSLRDDILTSPLCNGPNYTRTIEAAYRDMWQKWCKKN